MKSRLPWTENQWQTSLSEAVSDPKELLALLNLDPHLLCADSAAAKTFKLRVPRQFINRMRKNDLYDPLLMQVLPIQKELHSPPDYLADPLHEEAKNMLPGLLHKYSTRVLLVVSGACAIHCRYCFRREFDYAANNPGRKGWTQAMDYIRTQPLVDEVILSGGDPLMVTDHYLSDLIKGIANIPQIKRLRIHTRLPIVLPERITTSLLQALESRLKCILVIHTNHPNEIDDAVMVAMEALKNTGITLLNQSVLLKGVNDSAVVLRELSEKLFSAGVLPYYLHLLDKVKGASHFAVSRRKAVHIMRELSAALAGYLVPKLVEERAGEASKTLVKF